MADRTPWDLSEPLTFGERYRVNARRRWLRKQGRNPDSPEDQAWMDENWPWSPDITPGPLPATRPRRERRVKPQSRLPELSRDKDPRVVRPEGPCSLYKAYDSQGNLLYVGVTARGLWRARQHGYRSEWWVQMVRMEWEHFTNRNDLLDRETELIAKLNPIHNVIRPDPTKPRPRRNR